MEERDLNCKEEKSYYPIMCDFATKVTKIRQGETKVKRFLDIRATFRGILRCTAISYIQILMQLKEPIF